MYRYVYASIISAHLLTLSQTVDKDLARSLAHLQSYVTIKALIAGQAALVRCYLPDDNAVY